MFRRGTMRLNGLNRLLNAVKKQNITFALDDIFKICALVKKDDTLGLGNEHQFLTHLARSYRSLPSTEMNPFQKSLIESTLPPVADTADDHCNDDRTAVVRSGGSGGGGASSISPTARESGEIAARECLNELWRIARYQQQQQQPQNRPSGVTEEEAELEEIVIREVALSDQETVNTCVRELETLAKFLSAQETAALVKCLAVLNYQNHADIVWLTRRATEVSTSLVPSDACLVLLNLRRLGSKDSLTATNNRIAKSADELAFVDVLRVLQAFDLESNTSPSTLQSLQRVVRRAVSMLDKSKTTRYHTLLLSSCARYNIHQPNLIVPILMDVVKRFRHTVPECDLLPLLFTTYDMYLVDDRMVRQNSGLEKNLNTILTAFLHRLEEVIPTMEPMRIMPTIDTLSLLPLDTMKSMYLLLQRIQHSAGMLPPPHLTRCIQLLSSFPPAKGHPCMVSMAFAVSTRVEIFDRHLLEETVLALAQQEFFTEDFFVIVLAFLSKGGFQQVDQLFELLESCNGMFFGDARSKLVLHNALCGVSDLLNEEELARCKNVLLQKGAAPKEVQELLTAVRQARKKTLRRTNPHRNPVDDMLL